jgi:hypothetical protein
LIDINSSINCSEISFTWNLKCKICNQNWGYTEIEDNNTEGSPIFQEKEWKKI